MFVGDSSTKRIRNPISDCRISDIGERFHATYRDRHVAIPLRREVGCGDPQVGGG
jgi:hypothetical protein